MESAKKQRLPASLKDEMKPENAFPDTGDLGDAALNTYINDLRDMCREQNPSTQSITIMEARYLLQIAVAEKNSRNSTKLTKIAIAVAASSVLIGLANVVSAF